MVAKLTKRITEDSDLDAILDEPGWVSVSDERVKEIMEAAKRPPMIHHGGARPGAGRKPLSPKVRRVAISAMVAPKTAQRLRKLARDSKRSLGAVLDSLAL